MTFLTLTIASLACYLLTLLLSEDDGPFGVFRRLRAVLKREALHKSEVYKGIECMRCGSIWAAGPIAAYAMVHDREWMAGVVPWGDGFLLAMALSQLAIIFNRAFPER